MWLFPHFQVRKSDYASETIMSSKQRNHFQIKIFESKDPFVDCTSYIEVCIWLQHVVRKRFSFFDVSFGTQIQTKIQLLTLNPVKGKNWNGHDLWKRFTVNGIEKTSSLGSNHYIISTLWAKWWKGNDFTAHRLRWYTLTWTSIALLYNCENRERKSY